MSYEIGYRFNIAEQVFYFDQTSGGFSRGRVRQIKIITSIINLIVKDTIKYILLLSNGSTIQLNESAMFTESTPPSTPGPPTHFVTAQFAVGDKVWLANGTNNTISYVTICQIDVSKYDSITTLSYWINTETSDITRTESSTNVASSLLFATVNDAWVYLGVIAPSPTPTPTPENIDDAFSITKVNGSGVTLFRGMPVSINPSTEFILSGDDINALKFVGLVYDASILPGESGKVIFGGKIVNGSDLWDAIIVEGGDLQPAKRYYLGSLGKITAIPPTAPDSYSRIIGFASSDTELLIRVLPSVKL